MSAEENKALVRRVFEEIWNQGEMDVADEVFDANIVLHEPVSGDVHGLEGYKRLATMYLTAFPDGQFTIEEQIAEGDKVVTRFTATGTHKAELLGIQAVGASVALTGIGISRIADGKIVEGWDDWDTLGMLQQLGAVPSLAQSGA